MATQTEQRSKWEQLLLELTNVPTAAGREGRVIEWIEKWVADRPHLKIDRDAAGNLLISPNHNGSKPTIGGPIVFEGHLDHPAFVVDEVLSATSLRATFRGGVQAPYFIDAKLMLRRASSDDVAAHVTETQKPDKPKRPFHIATIELAEPTEVQAGDILTWDLPPSRIENGLLQAPVCDDLAAVAAALCALDELTQTGEPPEVCVLLTRAEEVGFVGAIAACKLGTIPAGARILALENSRSFADSPLGGGPIVRVGDRLSVFSPTLTGAVAKLAHELTGDEKEKNKSDRATPIEGFNWQRKLMPGGACEATAFCAFGHEATCLCLPLRNYHNMGNLDEVQPAVQAGSWTGSAPIEPETISLADFHNLVELLIACGGRLEQVEPMTTRLEKLYDERKYVIE